MTCPSCNEEIHYQAIAGWYHKGGEEYYPEPDCSGSDDESVIRASQTEEPK